MFVIPLIQRTIEYARSTGDTSLVPNMIDIMK